MYMYVIPALKGTQFYFLFVITAAGVVPCGGPKKSHSTLIIVQIIFSFGQGHHRIIIYIYIVVLDSSMLHAKFR